MGNAYTFAIVDPSDLIAASIEADIERCAEYVIGLVGRYIDWQGTLDFVVEIKPASQSPYPNIDGILPSVGQIGWNGSAWVNETLLECQTGVDLDPNRPDAGCTIYLAADGTIRNYGAPVWFDPNPQFEVDPGVPAGRHDFVGIFTHEVFHGLGFWAATQQWDALTVADGGNDLFIGAAASALLGRQLAFDPGFDHYGNDPGITRGLMYEFGNYERNRLDIGRIDLAVLHDLGHAIKTFEGLALFELIDTALDLTGTASADRLYGDYHANVLTGLAGDDEIHAGSGNDTLVGGDGADRLFGDGGNDHMTGGLGDDIYGVDSLSDTVVEVSPGEGVDEVRTSLPSYTLAANVENLTGISTTGQTLIGNILGNVITGGSGGDTLIGDGGDTLIGGLGNDIYVMLHPTTAIEQAGEGIDEIRTGFSQWFLADHFENLTSTSSEFHALYGNAADNVIRSGSGNADLYGEAGNDTLIGSNAVFQQFFGGDGDDLMIGGGGTDFYNMVDGGDVIVEEIGGGNDWVTAVSASYTLSAHIETLEGRASFGQALTGNAQANRIIGTDYNDVLNGGAGDDTLEGGFGDDVFIVDSHGDSVVDFFGDHDEIRTILSSYTLTSNIERLTGLAGTGQTLTGSDLANHIAGGAGNDRLDGGAGDDAMAGGLGNDVYVVDHAGDLVTEAAGAGTDTVEAAVNYTLGANIENLVLTGSALNATGNGLANTLTGNGLANRLDGKAGADAMAGGAGNDVYVVDYGGDTVVEAAGAGTDTVEASVTHMLGANVENLVLTGAAALNGTGNALANSLTGNAGANRLDGGAGADVMAGGAGNDIYVVDDALDQAVEASGAGKDQVRSSVSFTLGAHVEQLVLAGALAIDGTGNGLNNFLTGNAAANTLDGKAGADGMAGGAGDDFYVVDHIGDRVTENAGEGIDTVTSSVSFSLTGHVENLVLTGAAALTATGNSLANAIAGNAGANTINGGGGADAMAGGGGNDIYIVDNVGDVVTELAGQGTDLVKSTVTFTLGAEVEKLTLRGSGAIDGTGNAVANTIAGNEAANRLDGGAGADKLLGAGGNDVYIVDNVADQVIEASSGGGLDRVESSVSFTLGDHVEELVLTGAGAIDGTGNAGANSLTGNAAANRLDGGRGNDVLAGGGGDDSLLGGLGLDTLTGGAGNDRFVFDKAILAANADNILDFTRGADTIVLENAQFKGLAAGAMGASALAIGTSAADADDRIVYDPATGRLWYDADGSGATAQILFATLASPPATLAASDFLVI